MIILLIYYEWIYDPLGQLTLLGINVGNSLRFQVLFIFTLWCMSEREREIQTPCEHRASARRAQPSRAFLLVFQSVFVQKSQHTELVDLSRFHGRCVMSSSNTVNTFNKNCFSICENKTILVFEMWAPKMMYVKWLIRMCVWIY